VARQERLGELLTRIGLIDLEQLADALESQTRDGGRLGEILVQKLFLTEEQIANALAEQKDLPFVNLTSYPVDRVAVSLVPERVARMRHILPVGFHEDGSLVLAMSDPLDIEAIDDAAVRTGHRIRPVVVVDSQIRYAIDKYISSADTFQELLDAGIDEPPEQVVEDVEAPVVRLVHQLFNEAIQDRASDVHLEPHANGVTVRFRVDGVLHEVMQVPRGAKAGVISRIKVMADLNLAERRRPQDGRIALSVEGREVDFRVATLPTPFGESIVIRVLNQGLRFLTLEDLGMNEGHLRLMEDFLSRPHGAVLVSGPTGSGKSTTMYAALTRINDPERKIITIEDPIEYQMPGVTQVAVNQAIGLSFATGLRTMLRADPDVVMVGEIRDTETAEIAIRAALTGHLVVSSIHTNDAPSALNRLLDMRVPPFITSSGLIGVVAQRLVRKLCEHCKVPEPADPGLLESVGFTPDEAKEVKPFEAVGCDRCLQTGYSGRIGVFEIMPMDDDITRLFLASAPTEQLRALAVEHGMISLRRDALDKVASGVTSLAEVARIVA
jgi:type IV pilus assembly protein PilB